MKATAKRTNTTMNKATVKPAPKPMRPATAGGKSGGGGRSGGGGCRGR
jgi:hypothetical protein